MKEIRLDRIAGLDISKDDLLHAIEDTKPPSTEDKAAVKEDEFSFGPMRWSSTEVKIWLGGFQDYNSEFASNEQKGTGYECIVSSEVSVVLFNTGNRD